MPSFEPVQGWRRFLRARYLLPLLAVLVAVARLHTYDEPTDRDTATYAVVAHELLAGMRLYDGVLLDQKPPAIHATYALAELAAGYGRGQIYLLNITAAAITLTGVYFLGRALSGSQAAGLWLAVFWSVMSGHVWLEANQPNSEAFINGFTVWGLALVFWNPRCGRRWWLPVLAGACFALASLYKHVVVLIPAFLGVVCVAFPPGGRTRREMLREFAVVGCVGVAAWASLFAYFAATSRLSSVIECLVTYNQHYAGNQQGNMLVALKPAALFPRPLHALTPWFLLVAAGFALLLARREWRWALLLGALAAATHLVIAMPGRFFAHYYQLWFPFLATGGAVVLGAFERWRKVDPALRLAAPLCAVALAAMEAPNYALPAGEWSGIKYGQAFISTTDLAKALCQWLAPDEIFYQLGPDTQLYFDTKRRPVSVLANYGVFYGPLKGRLEPRLQQDLREQRPDLLVAEKGTLLWLHIWKHPLIGWLEENYELAPHSAVWDQNLVLLRRDSDMERRFKSGAIRAHARRDAAQGGFHP